MCNTPTYGRKKALEILKSLGGGNFRFQTAIKKFNAAEIRNPEKKFQTLRKGGYIVRNKNGTFKVA